jgi:hypothetical protein
MSGERPGGSALGAPLPKQRPSVIYQTLPDGAVLYCAEQELYFGLNRTGACIWEHLSPVCTTIDELCAVVGQRFAKVDSRDIRSDADRLLNRLAEHHLLVQG